MYIWRNECLYIIFIISLIKVNLLQIATQLLPFRLAIDARIYHGSSHWTRNLDRLIAGMKKILILS